MSPFLRRGGPRTVLFFASDLHGSEKCFRKFLNGGPIYGADVMVLGGDVAGKAIQSIEAMGQGRYRCTFRGTDYEVSDGDELVELEKLVADFGYYPYRCEPGELEAKQADGSMELLFVDLMRERLSRWTQMADERLRPKGLPVYWMLGNDDPSELEAVLDEAPWGIHGDGRIETLPSGHEFVTFGWSNITPWNSYRELPEEEITQRLEKICSGLERPETAIFNLHAPPYDTGLDEAPVLNKDLQVQQSAGQVKMAPVGSTAVRKIIEGFQPMLGLHGHIHESSGFRRIGRTLCINPGSDYGTGVLNGFVATIESDRIRAHQFVRG